MGKNIKPYSSNGESVAFLYTLYSGRHGSITSSRESNSLFLII